eukprot:2657282-Lingulodinium_polyedra.AAC.1
MKNTVGSYGIAVNYSTGGASKNQFNMPPKELIGRSANTDIFGAPWGNLGSQRWSEMCVAAGAGIEALS